MHSKCLYEPSILSLALSPYVCVCVCVSVFPEFEMYMSSIGT